MLATRLYCVALTSWISNFLEILIIYCVPTGRLRTECTSIEPHLNFKILQYTSLHGTDEDYIKRYTCRSSHDNHFTGSSLSEKKRIVIQARLRSLYSSLENNFSKINDRKTGLKRRRREDGIQPANLSERTANLSDSSSFRYLYFCCCYRFTISLYLWPLLMSRLISLSKRR